MASYVTSPHYAVDIGQHVFPTRKYALIVEQLRREHGATDDAFIAPEPATETELRRVHGSAYVDRCLRDEVTREDELRLELPWSPELGEASRRCVRGSIMAAELALDRGVGIHIGGGFHHAFPDHGEGFCVFNDHACAVRALQAQGRIDRALILDCDLHQGNGTAAIFARDEQVVTFSIHQQGIYPAFKPPSDLDIGLPAGTGDREYLDLLRRHGLGLLESARPDLVVHVAGADPFVEDQLGSLRLTRQGLRRRDGLIVEACAEHRLPLLLVLAGGYARRVEDTVSIHLGSVLEAAKLWT